MALQDKYFDCERNGSITWQDLIASVMRKDSYGNYFIAYVATTPDCDDLESAIECGDGGLDIIALLSKAIVLDCNSEPAINLAACTCQ